MGNDERVLLTVTFVALAALIVAKLQDMGAGLGGLAAVPVTNLTYNQPAWAYAPYTANVIPSAARSELGVAMPTNAGWDTTGWA